MNRNPIGTDKMYPAMTLPAESCRQQPAYRWALLLLVTVFMAAITPRAMADQQPADLEATVQYLITYIEGSDVTFQRNFSRYKGSEAAQHISKKYRHFKDDIDTPEKFIELCATGSLMTGKPYMIVTNQGEQLPSSEWLNAALADFRLRNQQSGD